SLFFAVLAGNLQRARRRVPQKSWLAREPATEKTAKHPLFVAVFLPKNSDIREMSVLKKQRPYYRIMVAACCQINRCFQQRAPAVRRPDPHFVSERSRPGRKGGSVPVPVDLAYVLIIDQQRAPGRSSLRAMDRNADFLVQQSRFCGRATTQAQLQ